MTVPLIQHVDIHGKSPSWYTNDFLWSESRYQFTSEYHHIRSSVIHCSRRWDIGCHYWIFAFNILRCINSWLEQDCLSNYRLTQVAWFNQVHQTEKDTCKIEILAILLIACKTQRGRFLEYILCNSKLCNIKFNWVLFHDALMMMNPKGARWRVCLSLTQ